jgi:hypothetical protein
MPMQGDWRKAMADIKGNYAPIDPIPFKAPAVDQNEIARDLMRRTQAAVLRITGIPATYLSQDALIAELQAANARLRTEVEALRVERDEARSRLVSAGETIRKLAAGEPAMWSDGKKVEVRGVYPPIRADWDEAWHDARMTGTGWLRVTQPEPEAPSTATHSKPFPAKAMR